MDRLRGADASGVPNTPGVHINAMTMVIAEKAVITGQEKSVADNSELTHDGVRKDAGSFRDVFSVIPNGIAVITAVDDGEPVGLTVGSLLRVSVEPPLVGFLAGVSSTSFARVRRSGAFCVNILTAGQDHISNAFAQRGADKFAGLSWRPAPQTGSPVLDGAAAWIDCRLTTVYEPGDHFMAIGEAADFDSVPGELPLIFHRGRYVGLETEKQTFA